MDVLANAFELVVLGITGVMVLALAAFIWSDALADRRRGAGSAALRAGSPVQGNRPSRRLPKRRLQAEQVAAS